MARKVRIYDDGEVQWPNSCAYCRAKTGLVSAAASIGRVTSVRPTLSGAIAVKGELLSMDYPVCQTHQRGLSWASLITRETAGFKFLRGLSYFFGIQVLLMMLIAIPAFIMRLMGGNPGADNGPELPGVMMVIFFFFALSFFLVISAYRKLPLRLVKRNDDGITIKFRNNIYAAEFARLNRDKVFE